MIFTAAVGCSPSTEALGVNSSSQPQNVSVELSGNVIVSSWLTFAMATISSNTAGSYAAVKEHSDKEISPLGALVRHAVLCIVDVSFSPPPLTPGGVTSFSHICTELSSLKVISVAKPSSIRAMLCLPYSSEEIQTEYH